MIDIKNLSLSRNGREVLKDINLSAQDGEIFGIIGPGGCGKSSLLNAIGGKKGRYEGEVFIDNRPVRSFSRREIAQKICSIPSLPENMEITISEFVLLARSPHKKTFNPFSDNDIQISQECIAGFELSQCAGKLLYNLSRTHLKETLLAFCFARQSDVIVLDDPTDGLDLRGQMLLQKTLFRYVIDGKKTAIVSGNDINFVAQTADKIAIMHDGAVKAIGGHELIDPDIIKQYFGADVFVSKNVYNGRPNVHFFPEG
jgi:iron complex transport system ATP-binding protein